MGPTGQRVCRRCGETKAISDFRMRTDGCAESWCRPCKNADAEDRRAIGAEALTPTQELERLRKRARPTEAEWAIVQRAAECIAVYLRGKAQGEGAFKGQTAWSVIEEYTGKDDKRFHQLISMAVLQQKSWEEERVGKIVTRGQHMPPELVERVRSKRLQKWSISRIATRFRISRGAVSDILAGLTYKPKQESAA